MEMYKGHTQLIFQGHNVSEAYWISCLFVLHFGGWGWQSMLAGCYRNDHLFRVLCFFSLLKITVDLFNSKVVLQKK